MAKKKPTKPALNRAAGNPFRDGFRRFLKAGPTPSTARTRSGRWKEPFVAALAGTGNVTLACRFAGVHRDTVYEHKKSDAAFAQAMQEALDRSIELMEAEMVRRAYAGVEEPIYQGGDKVGTITRYSDGLAMFLAKAHRPEKYRERIAVKNDNPERKPHSPAAVADKIAALLGEFQPPADPGGPQAGGPDQHSAG